MFGCDETLRRKTKKLVDISFSLPWSSGHDFRLSLTLRSAGDRGSIPRGRVSFLLLLLFPNALTYISDIVYIFLISAFNCFETGGTGYMLDIPYFLSHRKESTMFLTIAITQRKQCTKLGL